MLAALLSVLGVGTVTPYMSWLSSCLGDDLGDSVGSLPLPSLRPHTQMKSGPKWLGVGCVWSVCVSECFNMQRLSTVGMKD